MPDKAEPPSGGAGCLMALRLSGLHFYSYHTRKKARPGGGAPSLYLMPGSLWRASCPPPSGPLLRNVQ
ncbi:hypothetical protein EWD00_16080, partial [Salmonella enterica subsp. enterica serovar Ouagadougou]|nr:hypothetical protein [Salmonella enterica subsp. enterica serovar Ouagadougou]